MGGYGSGGHNRRKNCVGSSIKLDSFYFSKCIQILSKAGKEQYRSFISWNNGHEIGYILYQDMITVTYTVKSDAGSADISDVFYFNGLSNNYGGADRLYILCPYCSCRVRFLYLSRNHFKCRKCAKLNYRSQQETKNTDLAAYKMGKYIKEKFKVTDNLAPMDAVYYKPERPKGMHRDTYQKLLWQLYRLQEEYNKQFYASAIRIIKGSPQWTGLLTGF